MPSTRSVYQGALFLAARSAVAAILFAQAADGGPTQFWDLNGAGAGAGGAPSGTWDLITPNWSTDPSAHHQPRRGSTTARRSSRRERTQTVHTPSRSPCGESAGRGLRFEEGSVDVVAGAGATLALTAPNVDVATAIFANISQGISGNVGLLKLGNGLLQLSGSNSFTGPTAIRNGSLVLDYSQALAPASNIIPLNISVDI
jgi:autotransporter-associated beta strand protein